MAWNIGWSTLALKKPFDNERSFSSTHVSFTSCLPWSLLWPMNRHPGAMIEREQGKTLAKNPSKSYNLQWYTEHYDSNAICWLTITIRGVKERSSSGEKMVNTELDYDVDASISTLWIEYNYRIHVFIHVYGGVCSGVRTTIKET